MGFHATSHLACKRSTVDFFKPATYLLHTENFRVYTITYMTWLPVKMGWGKKWAGCWVYILNTYNNVRLLDGESCKPGTDGNPAFLVFS